MDTHCSKPLLPLRRSLDGFSAMLLGMFILSISACSHETPQVAEAAERKPVKLVLDARVVAPGGPRTIAVPHPPEHPRVASLEVVLGQRVDAKTPLAVLEGLTEAQLAVEIARSELRRAEIEVERAAGPYARAESSEPQTVRLARAANARRERLRTIAEERRSALRRAELRAAQLRVRAPVAGRITAIHARRGEAVDPARGLMTLVPNTRVVLAELDRKRAKRLRVGLPAIFSSQELEEPLQGRILRVETYQTTARIAVIVAVAGNALLEQRGTHGTLTITLEKDRSAGNQRPTVAKRPPIEIPR